MSDTDNLNHPTILQSNLKQQSHMLKGCNFQDIKSMEEMFANMDLQVQAYYQLQENIA